MSPNESKTQSTAPRQPASSARSSSNSHAKIIKQGWGTRQNFQHSYGLKLTPDDMAEGDAILAAMEQNDTEVSNVLEQGTKTNS